MLEADFKHTGGRQAERRCYETETHVHERTQKAPSPSLTSVVPSCRNPDIVCASSWPCKWTTGTNGKYALKCRTLPCRKGRYTLAFRRLLVMSLTPTSKSRRAAHRFPRSTNCPVSYVRSIVSVTTNQIYTNKTYGAPPVNAARPASSQRSKSGSSAGFASWFLFLLKAMGVILFCVFAFSAWVS